MNIFGGTRGNTVRTKKQGAGVWAAEGDSVCLQDKGRAAAPGFLNKTHHGQISGTRLPYSRVLLSANGRPQSPEALWQQDNPSLVWLLVNQHHYGLVDSRVCSIYILLSPNRYGRGLAFVSLQPNMWLSRLSAYYFMYCWAFNLANQTEWHALLVPSLKSLYALQDAKNTQNIVL